MIIYSIYSIILSPFLACQIKQKLCIRCKFYTKNFFTSSEFGKCSLFTTENEDTNYLVNGNKNNNDVEYHYCSTARKFHHMCGKEGKFFEKKQDNCNGKP
jgi:hypothetical protein